MKRVTRRHVRAWLSPIRACFNQMKTGEVDSMDGYAVTQLHEGDDYVRIDYCIAGFRGMINRVLPQFDDSPLLTLEQKLSENDLLTHQEVEAAMTLLRQCETALVGLPVSLVVSASRDEQIAVNFQQMGVL